MPTQKARKRRVKLVRLCRGGTHSDCSNKNHVVVDDFAEVVVVTPLLRRRHHPEQRGWGRGGVRGSEIGERWRSEKAVWKPEDDVIALG